MIDRMACHASNRVLFDSLMASGTQRRVVQRQVLQTELFHMILHQSHQQQSAYILIIPAQVTAISSTAQWMESSHATTFAALNDSTITLFVLSLAENAMNVEESILDIINAVQVVLIVQV